MFEYHRFPPNRFHSRRPRIRRGRRLRQSMQKTSFGLLSKFQWKIGKSLKAALDRICILLNKIANRLRSHCDWNNKTGPMFVNCNVNITRNDTTNEQRENLPKNG